MIPNNNLSVLPWYTDLRYQNHRLSYAYGAIYPLFTPSNMILPFQIMRETKIGATFSVNLYNEHGTLIANITQRLLELGLQLVRFESLGYDVIVFPAYLPLADRLPVGIHYMTLSDGVDTWYSEMFTVVNDILGYLKIEWYDVDNFVFDAGQIVYKNPSFKNVLYLCSEVGKPDYVFEEEGENRDGYFFPEKQISEKTYRFQFMAPEYLCDALRIVRMSDHVLITSRGQIYECDTFLITPRWQTQGDLASVEVEFQNATVVKKIGRGVMPGGGDFNNDFNDDFLID